jgi:site-specific recombinase XerD
MSINMRKEKLKSIDRVDVSSSFTEYKNHLEIKNKADSTIKDYLALALKLINHLIKNNIDPYNLSIEHIEKYLAKNKRKGLSDNTYAKFVNCTRIFLNFLYDREYLKHDIAKRIEPVRKIKTIERVILYEDEVKIIECYIKSRRSKRSEYLRALIIFHLGISCGLRRQEMINLNWNDLELDEIRKPFIKIIKSKGKKSRIVYLNDDLYKLMKDYRKTIRRYTGPIIRGDYGKRITKSSLQSILRRIYKGSGVYKKGLNIHSLRHTYAERLRKNKTDIATISILLGHSRLDTTMAYFHVDREDLQKAVL